ncbi:hypothetical protein DPEC_G00048830 [Dallia pectoralis]|uniref:Uncharacterized protein n=1 Tax=Dallia pectoralis TaxID=75939 RepID=A0ACC2HAW7_DALPE|nr:hypothetical protein DPEC_G00048830 [Dallia pectoralis]
MVDAAGSPLSPGGAETVWIVGFGQGLTTGTSSPSAPHHIKRPSRRQAALTTSSGPHDVKRPSRRQAALTTSSGPHDVKRPSRRQAALTTSSGPHDVKRPSRRQAALTTSSGPHDVKRPSRRQAALTTSSGPHDVKRPSRRQAALTTSSGPHDVKRPSRRQAPLTTSSAPHDVKRPSRRQAPLTTTKTDNSPNTLSCPWDLLAKEPVGPAEQERDEEWGTSCLGSVLDIPALIFGVEDTFPTLLLALRLHQHAIAPPHATRCPATGYHRFLTTAIVALPHPERDGRERAVLFRLETEVGYPSFKLAV